MILHTTPPSSNRGVQNTERSALRACVDWVQVTFTFTTELEKIYDILGMKSTDFMDAKHGNYGYKSQKFCNHISIFYDGGPGMGVHVQMTGQGCREYETFNLKNWKDFFIDCFGNDAKFTRLDAAIDDIATLGQKPYFTIDTLYQKARKGCVRSKFKKGKHVNSFFVDTGESLGETLYFGREQSDMQIRFYEKDFERADKGVEVEDNIIVWNRTELQMRRDRAQAFALYIVNRDDLGDIVTSVLKNYLNFLIPDKTDTNKARWKVCKWWDDFLGDVQRLKLTMVAPDRTIESATSWINKQVAPTLGMLFVASGSDMDLFVETLNDGMDRLTDQQLKMAEEHWEKIVEERKNREQAKEEAYQLMMFRTINTHKKSLHSLRENEDHLQG